MTIIADSFLGKVSLIMAPTLLLAINSAAAKMPAFVLSNAMDGTPLCSTDYDDKTLFVTL